MKATRAAARELVSDEYGEYGEYGEDSEHGDESGEDVDKVNFVLSIKEENSLQPGSASSGRQRVAPESAACHHAAHGTRRTSLSAHSVQ